MFSTCFLQVVSSLGPETFTFRSITDSEHLHIVLQILSGFQPRSESIDSLQCESKLDY